MTTLDLDDSRATTSPPWRSLLVREAVLVALIPATGYGVAYAFALGRSNQLGIPSQLISIDITAVLRGTAAVIAPLAATYSLFLPFLNLLSVKVWTHVRWAALPIILFVGSVVVLRAAQAHLYLWIAVLGGIFLLLVIPLTIAMIANRDKKGLKAKYVAATTPQANRYVASSTVMIERLGWANYVIWVCCTDW
jgi:hypothetical protein